MCALLFRSSWSYDVIASGTGDIEFFLTALAEGNSQHEQTVGT